MTGLLRTMAFLTTVSFAIPIQLRSQIPTDGKDTLLLTKMVQFAIPATPALSFIGATSEKIARPVSAKEFATFLSNSIDEAGKLVQGLAVEVAIRQAFFAKMDQTEYASRRGFVLANTALSLGTAKTTGDSASTNLGLGLRTTFVDRSDPMSAAASGFFRARLEEAALKCLPAGPIGGDAKKLAEFKACFAPLDSAARHDWRRDHWNGLAFNLAWATGVQFGASDLQSRSSLGHSVTAVLALPACIVEHRSWLCRHGQWLVQAGYEKRDSVLGSPTPTERVLFGARGTVGTDQLGVFGEFLQATNTATSGVGTPRRSTDWSAGVEFRVSDGLWATTGVGSRYLAEADEDKVVVLAGLRVNVNKDRSLTKSLP